MGHGQSLKVQSDTKKIFCYFSDERGVPIKLQNMQFKYLFADGKISFFKLSIIYELKPLQGVTLLRRLYVHLFNYKLIIEHAQIQHEPIQN